METVSGFGEAPAERDSMRAPFETWAQVDATYVRYFKGEATIEDIGRSLDAHAKTLPHFIEKYLDENEGSRETNIINLHHILLGLHQEPFETNVTASRLDRSFFILMSDEEIVERANLLITIIEEREAAGKATDIVGSICGEAERILKRNNRSLVEPIEKSRQKRRRQIQKAKGHAYNAGRILAGGAVGAFLYSRIQSGKKLK